MPATKVRSDWVSGNLVFSEKVAANGGQVIFGGTNGGVDVVFRGTTSGIYSMWDESANAWINKDINLDLGDNDKLLFGDSTDASICWDTAKLALTAATASTFQLGTSTANINTRFVGTLIVGSTGKSLGKDVTFYGTTAVARLLWDADQNTLDLDGAGIHLDDTDKLRMGDSTDATLCWDASKVALVAATTSSFQIGSSSALINTRVVGTLTVGDTGKSLGKNVIFYGTTAVNNMTWTATNNMMVIDGCDILLKDSDYLKLGDSTDASLCWDTAKIALTAATTSSFQVGSATAPINTRFVGTLTVGTTGANVGKNVTLYGTSTSFTAVWTAASNMLILDKTDIRLGDTDFLIFGDSTAGYDAELSWDAAKLALTAPTTTTFQIGTSTAKINTRFVGTVIVGSTGVGLGKNVTLYGTTTANTAIWTAASDMLVFDNADIRLGDGDYLKLGDSSAGYDAQLSWNATKLALTAPTTTTFQIGSSSALINTRFAGTLIVGTTGVNLGKNVIFYGTSTANNVTFAAATNLLTLSGVSLKLGNTDTVRGTSTASQTYSLNAWGTGTLPVMTVKNSTGNTVVKCGFFGKTDGVRIATIAAATTISDVVSGFNTLLAGLKVFGLCST